jgi:DNA repair protein RadC
MSNSFNLDLFRRTYQGPTVRVKLIAAENAASYLPAIPFTSSKDVSDYFSTLEEEPREVVIATYLDNKHHVLSIEEVSRGTLTASLFEPRAILQGAVLTNAAALIMVHNHPSGDPKPSVEDLSVTKSLKQLTDVMPIRLLDHIIIGRKNYFSLHDSGQLEAANRRNGKPNGSCESTARKIPPRARSRHAGSAKSAGGSESECV